MLPETAVGVTFLLGDRLDDAVRWLTDATGTCRALEFPFEHTRAFAWLGQALEQKGDKAGACTAYRVVDERWGQARPRSVTAERAREREKALGCGP
jgi:eukaryotic-like serine/threonine-protein kinase